MMRSRIWILGWLGAACLAAALSLPPAGLSAGPPTIGVPDFAADNLPPGVTDFFPGGAAADAATVLLQRTASPQLTVISRKDMAQAQIAVKSSGGSDWAAAVRAGRASLARGPMNPK